MTYVAVVVGVCLLLAVGIVVIVRRLVKSKAQLMDTRIGYTRMQSYAQAARSAYQREAHIADTAMQQAAQALHVAQKIDIVSDQMDFLVGLVSGDAPDELPSVGRHAVPRADQQAITRGGHEQ